MGESPGQVVMGGKSSPDGCGFELQYLIHFHVDFLQKMH